MNRLLATISCAAFAAVLSCTAVNAQPTNTPNSTAPTTPAPADPAAGAATNAAAKPLTGVVGDHNATLNDRIPAEQMLTLQAGSETFVARYIADLSGLPRGAVIILHASGQHPSWPFTVAALIDDLPLHGWSTLSIELPPSAQDSSSAVNTAAPSAPPAASPATTPAGAAAATNTPAAAPPATNGPEPRAQAHIAAAIKYFVDQKQTKVVLLGFGSGATRAAESVRQMLADPAIKKPDPISALVLIAPVNHVNGIEQDLPKILPSSELPTLDIILSSDPLALADAEERRRAVLHQRQRIYRRLELPPIAAAETAQHSLMVRRVRAWLQRQADGEPKD